MKVLEVDIPRKRIALTMRLDDAAEPRPKSGERVARGQERFLRQSEPKSEGALATRYGARPSGGNSGMNLVIRRRAELPFINAKGGSQFGDDSRKPTLHHSLS